jgi:uncharacterized membrane protein YfcA
MLLAVPFGLLIGLVVGTVGGGGAILALPVLVYVLGEGVGPATTESLIVVALAAAFASGASLREREVCWRIALLFAAPAAAGALLGALANHVVAGRTLVLLFVPVMLLAAGATWQRAGRPRDGLRDVCPPAATGWTLLAGFAIGALTGFFGVGGGFLIVPVLTLGFGVCMRRAVATSLAIIALTAVAALASHMVVSGAQLDVALTAALAAATALGAVLGTSVRRGLPQRTLARGFALLVLAVACFLIVDVALLGGPPGAG